MPVALVLCSVLPGQLSRQCQTTVLCHCAADAVVQRLADASGRASKIIEVFSSCACRVCVLQ